MRGRCSQATPGCRWRLGPNPKGTCPLGPDGVRQNVAAVLLEQHGGMVDQRNPQSAAFHASRRYRRPYVRDEAGDRSGRLVSFHRSTSRKPGA